MGARTSATRIAPWLWAQTSLVKYVARYVARPSRLRGTTRHVGEPSVLRVPTRHGDVRCLVHRPHPEAPLAGDRPPVHVHLHGGGFVMANPRQDDFLTTYIAAEVGAVVVSVDYSTAPQVRFPVAEEQAADVLSWVAGVGDDLGWDGTRITIGGISAGAKLAISALQLARRAGGPTARAAVVLVPPVDLSVSPEDLRSPLAEPMIDSRMLHVVHGTYFVDASRRTDPLASPARDPHVAEALPPLLVITGEHDTLTPAATDFVRRLRAQGATVTHHDLPGVDHDLGTAGNDPDGALPDVLEPIGSHLLRHLAGPPAP